MDKTRCENCSGKLRITKKNPSFEDYSVKAPCSCSQFFLHPNCIKSFARKHIPEKELATPKCPNCKKEWTDLGKDKSKLINHVWKRFSKNVSRHLHHAAVFEGVWCHKMWYDVYADSHGIDHISMRDIFKKEDRCQNHESCIENYQEVRETYILSLIPKYPMFTKQLQRLAKHTPKQSWPGSKWG
jgi:hypothetical protein